MNIDTNTIFLVDDIDKEIQILKDTLPKHFIRIIRNTTSKTDEFQTLQAKNAINEAYITTQQTKYILLCGTRFTIEAQNRLLKVIEEPPRKIRFIIITTSISSIIPTIQSRLQKQNLKPKITLSESSLDLVSLDLKELYNFLKAHQKIGKKEAIVLIEQILIKAHNQKLKLSSKLLELFSKSIKLVDLNSKPINILTTLLLGIYQQKIDSFNK